MLKTKGLGYQYPGQKPILFPDIEVGSTETLLIVGESGSGKTTLLHLLAGLLRPAQGEVLVDGTDMTRLAPAAGDRFRGRFIGLVYQKPYFIDALPVLDNLLISPFAQSREKAVVIAQRLGIHDHLRQLPAQLSVGEQQRASIARAIMNNPKLLLADEPTSALDNGNCKTVVRLLQEQALDAGAALVVVTHDDRLRKVIPNQIELVSTLSQKKDWA